MSSPQASTRRRSTWEKRSSQVPSYGVLRTAVTEIESSASRSACACGGIDDAAVGKHHQMGVVDRDERREEERLRVLEVVVEDLRHVLRIEPHSSRSIARRL